MELKDEKLEEVVKEGIVLVDFYATWCGPCKMQSVVLEEMKDQVKIVSVDTDEHEELAKEYGILSIPTLILFKDGQERKKQVGFTSKEDILDWIREIEE